MLLGIIEMLHCLSLLTKTYYWNQIKILLLSHWLLVWHGISFIALIYY